MDFFDFRKKAKVKAIKAMDFTRNNWKSLLLLTGSAAALVYLSSKESNDNECEYNSDYDDYDSGDVRLEGSIIATSYKRYKVELRAFKTGEWYTKTETDYINSAHSVASCNNFGRACRVTDTNTGDILLELDEEKGAAEVASQYRKY